MRVGVIVATFVLAAPYDAQAQITHFDAGLHTGSFTRQGDWVGTTGGYGGWISAGAQQFSLEVDLARSTTLQQPSESACIDDRCARSAPGTSFERNWALGVTALWRFRTTSPVTPHVLVGVGQTRRNYLFDFEDPVIADHRWRSAKGGLVGGGGLDFPTASRFFGRVQYRLNVAGEDWIHQFRVGGGVRF